MKYIKILWDTISAHIAWKSLVVCLYPKNMWIPGVPEGELPVKMVRFVFGRILDDPGFFWKWVIRPKSIGGIDIDILSIGKMMINTGIGFHFSRMRSKGSRFTLGVWRSTLRLRPQPSATIRNRPQPFAWGPHGRAYGKFCKRGHFWMFPASRSCVSRGRRGASWH